MSENNKFPGEDQRGPSGTEHQDDELDIGNDISVGSENGSDVSDFEDSEDLKEQRQKSGTGGSGDDQRSSDNGINPLPGEVDPEKKALNNDLNVENSDEDHLNPYPDELKPDGEDHKVNSTWMVSGQNRDI